MEVEIFHIFELAAGCRKQLFAQANMRVHRAANIEKHQHLHFVAAFGNQLNVEIAGIGG